ncbi:unnamed protein product [Diatraea saccharalis]|uniref:FP protein C-terminal domain-containing protein n=1 Tax=Diatraea saccharalis TaxID=40085 RepID=A0A9N9QWQ7_9NEOP|nr:unnamed protein product [Diatraea saccharalis]
MTHNKSLSESNLFEQNEHTPPNFLYQRNKRPREHDCESELKEFKEEMKAMISSLMATQRDDIKKIYPTLLEIKNTNDEIKSSVTYLTAQNKELEKEIEQLEIQNRKDKSYICLLENRVENLQRESLRSHIEIKNVPKITRESREDLLNMITKLSNTIKYDIKEKDIKDIYRVRDQKDNTRTVSTLVVELASTMQKTDLLKLIKTYNIKNKEKLCGKHLELIQYEKTPIYVSEKLTALGARLYFLARDLTKSKAYKFCWTSFGKVYVRKDEASPIILIKNESQVNSLMQQI